MPVTTGSTFWEMYDRHALVAAINEVLQAWSDERPSHQGNVLCILDALGYTTGNIFSQAPDGDAREIARMYFMSAMEAGLHHTDISNLQ